MKKYIKYLMYILEHKKNVFKTCWKRGLYLHAFTHDLSKFRPSEFIPYARYFYGRYIPHAVLSNIAGIKNKDKILTKEKVKEDFEKAWKKHYSRNKHHWNYWCRKDVPKDIPDKYLQQMIADWEGMSLKFGDTAQSFYIKNYWDIKLTWNSRIRLERMLGLTEIFNEPDKLLIEFMSGTVGKMVDDINNTIEEKFKVNCYEEFNLKRK